MRVPTAVSVTLALSLAAACGESPTSIVNLTPGAENVVAVGNDANAFAFAVQARALTLEQTYDLAFQSETTSIGLAVVGYAGGRATLELLDETGTPIFTRSLAANTAEGTSDVVTGRPARARLSFTDYTGIVALGVNGD